MITLAARIVRIYGQDINWAVFHPPSTQSPSGESPLFRSPDARMIESRQQMRREDTEVNRSMHSICGGR
jgi:hypothetical protein